MLVLLDLLCFQEVDLLVCFFPLYSLVAENNSSPAAANSLTVATDHQREVKEACDDSNGLETSDSNGLDNDDFHERYKALIFSLKGGLTT